MSRFPSETLRKCITNAKWYLFPDWSIQSTQGILNLWIRLSVWKAGDTKDTARANSEIILATDYILVCVCFHSQVSILSSKRSMNVGIFLKQFKRWVSGNVHKVWLFLHNELVVFHCKTTQDEVDRLVCSTPASCSQTYERQHVTAGLIYTVLQLQQVASLWWRSGQLLGDVQNVSPKAIWHVQQEMEKIPYNC